MWVSTIDSQGCLISFGANLGDPIDTIRLAANMLQQALDLDEPSFRLSRLYRTSPVGGPAGQPPFVNAVAAIQTAASPWQVWHTIRQVEARLGRQRNERWEARTIDLDILLYANERIWTPQLKIPHPRMAMRRFILVPALDVASDWIDPVTNMSLMTLAGRLRTGPANVLVVGNGHGEKVAVEATRMAMAKWVDAEILQAQSANLTSRSQGRLPLSTDIHRQQSRWISFLNVNISSNKPWLVDDWAKLTLLFAPPLDCEDIAWEDYHQLVAARLGLCDIPVGVSVTQLWPIIGARYLLSSNNDAWAAHEIVSALEAMDCPVEPITEV